MMKCVNFILHHFYYDFKNVVLIGFLSGAAPVWHAWGPKYSSQNLESLRKGEEEARKEEGVEERRTLGREWGEGTGGTEGFQESHTVLQGGKELKIKLTVLGELVGIPETCEGRCFQTKGDSGQNMGSSQVQMQAGAWENCLPQPLAVHPNSPHLL